MKLLLVFLNLTLIAVEIDTDLFREISQISGEIVKTYSPDRHIYVGIGRSPTSLVADLQNKGLPAYNIPLTCFSMIHYKISQQLEKKLFEHFDLYFPQSNDKDVVLIDFTLSGDSLFYASFYFSRYQPLRKIKTFALVNEDSFFQHEFNSTFNVSEMELNSYLIRHGFDDDSEFGKFIFPSDPIEKKEPREKYLQLKNQLLKLSL